MADEETITDEEKMEEVLPPSDADIPMPPVKEPKEEVSSDELQAKLRKDFEEKEKRKQIKVDDQEKLHQIDPGQLVFALKDILFKADYAEKRYAFDTKVEPPIEEEKLAAGKELVDNLKKSVELLIAEFKRRKMKYSHIKAEPERKCAFYKTCREKIRSSNKEREVPMILPCYSCEFNSVDKRLPDPRSEFVVVRRSELPRHHKELKVSMPLDKWEASLIAATVGAEEPLLVLSLTDPVAQACGLKFLEARRKQYLMEAQKAFQEAKNAGQIEPNGTDEQFSRKQRGEQLVNAAVQDVVRKKGTAGTGDEPEVEGSEEVGEGDSGGDQGDRGSEDSAGDVRVRDLSKPDPKPTLVEKSEGENTTTEEEGTEEQKEE